MVTFRFYVVSTVAFFLALAVGVVVGSVLDGRIADSLQDRLDGVEQSLDETVAVIDARKADLERDQRYIEASAPFAVQDRLSGTATLVVAENGIDPLPVEDLVRRLRESGSRVEGIVWLDRRWTLDDETDLAAAAEIAGLSNADGAEQVRVALWDSVLGVDPTTGVSIHAGASTGDAGSGTTSTTSTTSTTALAGATTTTLLSEVAGEVPPVFTGETLAALADEGLLRLQVMDGGTELVAGELLVATATGTESTMAEPGSAVGELLATASGASVPSVVGESVVPPGDDSAGEPPRGRIVGPLVESGAGGFSSVDDLDLVAGRVAMVLALADGREGRTGRYGYGPDVDGVLPPWQGP